MTGVLVKMPVRRAHDGMVHYTIRLLQSDGEFVENPINAHIGHKLQIVYTGKQVCVHCRQAVRKLFAEGLCYTCFQNAPEAAPCIIRPELCEAHLGKGRNIEWEQRYHYQPHVVYLAVSHALKVGVTRDTQIPTRWIDQGAAWAVVVAKTPYRQLAGRIEQKLKALYTDRTSWQRMLKGEKLEGANLAEEHKRITQYLTQVDVGLVQFLCFPKDIVHMNYPIQQIPQKPKSVNLLKNSVIQAVLRGIRGQYLLFEQDIVFNIRRHSGFHIEMQY